MQRMNIITNELSFMITESTVLSAVQGKVKVRHKRSLANWVLRLFDLLGLRKICPPPEPDKKNQKIKENTNKNKRTRKRAP